MGKLKKIFTCLIAVGVLGSTLASRIKPISNHKIVSLKQDKEEIVRAFLRRTTFIRGSLHPVRLVLFTSGSSEQASLAKYIGIPEALLELEIQRTSNSSAQPKRVNTDQEMLDTVGDYSGSLGYISGESVLIYNTGYKVVFLEIAE